MTRSVGIFSVVKYKNLSFIIMDCPTSRNCDAYITELQARNVKAVVRLCESTYSDEAVAAHGIAVHDLFVPDGGIPSDEIIGSFLGLCTAQFGALGDDTLGEPNHSVAVHCIAGLGRAPVMVCIALIEAGMDRIEAVEAVRKARRGALNSVQCRYLTDDYVVRCAKKSVGVKALFGKWKAALPTNKVFQKKSPVVVA
ncbi:protein tyrosine phosphatase type IVA protein 1 [Polychytrium aggregatum]|uniref:protein tyrosine phosphatase type IVA protein 1 n=1 Tax=Polychytrium aggregatum TaxID=110093 RepID=UPI0022FDB675|nr:protein tyrosine phosphatase type IVA protein 1 [Polychytrium aggregatum]KAI9205933.1 protein tyrosine phosphatase type IVA protein 1 [Polychytrium aggregatum]